MPAKAGIHVFNSGSLLKTWMPGTGPGMTTSQPAVGRGLQPRLCRGDAFLEGLDLVGVLERHADVVEPFKQARAVGRRDVELDIRATGAADRLAFEIDREWRSAI